MIKYRVSEQVQFDKNVQCITQMLAYKELSYRILLLMGTIKIHISSMTREEGAIYFSYVYYFF